jgi:hypothetical protein
MLLRRWTFSRSESRGAICVVGLISFAAGSLITAQLVQLNRPNANRVFELRIYHALPGKLPALESRFRERTSRLLAKHDLKVVGYWVSESSPGWDNTFVDVLAYASREDANKNWAALVADPEFQEVIKSEQADKLVEREDSIYMHPTDFSPMK